MKKILNKTKCYLIGAMQYEDGRSWRELASQTLLPMGITVFDPYKRPFIDSPDEDETTHALMKSKMESGDYDFVSEFFKKVRQSDLSMVDRSDFILAYINPKVFTAGTLEELFWAIRLKRPIFLVIEGGKKNTPFWLMGAMPHKYIYDSMEDAIKMIWKINNGDIIIDSSRWRLLKEELR